ncbi:intraflagellar transport protein 81 homolog [Macrosteles quadrilineatus]|uniref:intraflagellar transport protein 81 homolog n=1 Tax=Macrosteles quadrilineatus TaxID=74068 RepID=UPI0023E32C48|nr:intraflagellar transport protein 81 homolog [Macrosteles quadrilineatus]
MSEILKYIVSKLNEQPFNKKYNLISFDSLSPEDLLQVLTDVLAEVEPSNKVDVRAEEPEQTVVRLLTMLRVLKYKPSKEINVGQFRQGLVQGDKRVIHPILEWLLKNMEDLRKRAYIAKFLVKIEIPPEILGDADIANLVEQYDRLIEEFKATHKESENVKSTGNSVAELRSDIEAMEKEHNIVSKKIERMQRKVENVENKDTLLEACRELRVERERQKDLTNQKAEEGVAIQQLQQKATRLSQQLRELRQNSSGATSQGLLQRLEEEIKMTSYIVNQKLPREIEQRQKEVDVLSMVANEPVLTRSNLDLLQAKVQVVTSEVNELVERHLATSNPSDDKLAPFRQQAAIIGRKKDTIAEQFSELRVQHNKLLDEISSVTEQLRQAGGETGVLRGDEFKRYVTKLRARSSIYKRSRAELAAMKAEAGVLARTLDILKARLSQLAPIEETSSHAGKDSFDDHDNSAADLKTKIAMKKAQLTPLIKELQPLRETAQAVTAEYEERKQSYDRMSAALDSTTAKLEQEVLRLREERQVAETGQFEAAARIQVLQVMIERVAEEVRRYVEKDQSPTIRDKLQQKIVQQERLSRQLKEEQQRVRSDLEKKAKQRQLWTDLQALLECKKQCQEDAKRNAGILHRVKGAETLVLQ